jgi:hypothetical protein
MRSVVAFMSASKIVVDGSVYVRSREAARVVQLAPDYVSRLARGRLVDGRLVAGLWFINLESLKRFLADQERQKERWYAELARRRRDEQRAAGHPSALKALFT